MSFRENDHFNYPWEHVEDARQNRRLQRKHPFREAASYRQEAKACPKCGKPASELAWFYFESPKWTLENLCGCGGWMTVCDACRLQVDFFEEFIT